ncbi:MAG: MOSC N-terminal beta barrel domain-containing protein [Candidatus Acidiferrum sp.]
MDSQRTAPRLANIRLHPIKALDPVSVSEARIGPAGGLELDRVWALYSADGRWVNGKRTAAMHLIRAAYSPDVSSVTLTVPGDRREIPAMTFAFPGDADGAAEWFSMYFEQAIQVRYTREGFPDDGLAPGPTIVSTSSLEAVCEWSPGMTLDEARRRFRTTLEIDGAVSADAPSVGGAAVASEKLPAFWEDQLFAESESSVVRFRIGDVAFEGSNPCARCPVPSRDSRTGALSDGFQKRFSELRRAQLPSWAPAERFDHFYRLATNTRVPSTEIGRILRVGDPLTF